MKHRPLPPTSRRKRVLLAQAWWQDRVLRGVADYASKHGWELQCRMHWTHQLPGPSEWKGDGIIAYAGISEFMRKDSEQFIAFVRAAGVPVVETQTFGNFFDAPKVIIPHEEIGRIAGEYLATLNFDSFGYVSFDENPLEQHRQRGMERAVAEAGGKFHSLTPQTLAQTIARLPRPMALAALNDVNAIQVIQICHDAGFSVPEEFAVMGADNSEIICDLAAVPVTSIDCNFEGQGYEAAALLDQLMDGAPKPAEAVIIPPKGVVVRRSTDTLAIRDLNTARVLRFLRDHYRSRFTLQQMAAELNVPLRQVQSSFREHVGQTMLQELTRLRVEHAKRLLPDRQLKLETIGFESGFSNRFHFVQAFHRITGQSPRAYRRASAKN